MKRANQITGIILLIFSGYVIMTSMQMPLRAITGRTSFAPSTGFLPMWLGVFMAILSILLIVNATLQQADSNQETVFPRGRALVAVALFLAGLAAYIALLEVIGYLSATAFLTAFLLRFVMQTRWRTTLLVAVGASIVLFVIFQVLLHVDLPKNMFGF
jgi:putative tricarboxylic transport membrane protein